MAKKLVETLEGYSPDMTPEEKLALLEAYELPDETPPTPEPKPKDGPKPTPKPSGSITKQQYDKLASDYATLKKELRSKLSEEEQREAERAEREAARDAELETLRKERQISKHQASLLGLGFDETLAAETAQFLAEGDADGLFGNMRKFVDTTKKSILAEALKNTPRPTPSEADAAAKKAEDAKIDAAFGLEPEK